MPQLFISVLEVTCFLLLLLIAHATILLLQYVYLYLQGYRGYVPIKKKSTIAEFLDLTFWNVRSNMKELIR